MNNSDIYMFGETLKRKIEGRIRHKQSLKECVFEAREQIGKSDEAIDAESDGLIEALCIIDYLYEKLGIKD